MSAFRLANQNIFNKITKCSLGQSKSYSTVPKTAFGGLSLVDQVVTTKDNSTFVAYHPNREFPYELTRPLPPPTRPSSSLIKDEAIQAANKAFTSKHPELVREELRKVTFTTKHIWFPRGRDKKAKKTPMDREYL